MIFPKCKAEQDKNNRLVFRLTVEESDLLQVKEVHDAYSNAYAEMQTKMASRLGTPSEIQGECYLLTEAIEDGLVLALEKHPIMRESHISRGIDHDDAFLLFTIQFDDTKEGRDAASIMKMECSEDGELPERQ